MNTEENTSIIHLRDGRKLAYSTYGDANGESIIFFHGYTSSRLEGFLLDIEAKEYGVQIISPDRPGVGLSDYQPYRKITNWVEDTKEMIEQLKLEHVRIIGMSAGGIYALACAHEIPDMIDSIVLIAPLGAVDFQTKGMRDMHKLAFKLANLSPVIFRWGYWFTRSRFFNVDNLARAYCFRRTSFLSNADLEFFTNPYYAYHTVNSQIEACKYGFKGLIQEAQMLGKPWDFRIEDIELTKPIYIWQGKEDCVVPYESSIELNQRLKNSYLHLYPEEGHYSVKINKANEIFFKILN